MARTYDPPPDPSRAMWALAGVGISIGLMVALLVAMKPAPAPVKP